MYTLGGRLPALISIESDPFDNPLTSISLKALMVCLLVLTQVSCSKGINESFFSSNGVRIHYVDSKGDGSPLVLLHGYSLDLNMWYEANIAQSLEKDFRVISIDLRGHGESDKPTSPRDYGPKVGEDVVNLLNHLEIEKAHIIGYSMGAFVVGRLLVTHPERIGSATLVSGSFPVANLEEEKFQEATAKDMDAHGDEALASVARGWAFDAVTEQQIAGIVTPIQAVFGSEENGVFYELQERLLKLPLNSLPILVIEGADHDSEKAAVLHPKLLDAAKNLINSTKDG